ncbi:hypothetical protein DFQ28_002009 [Apophysomyces sp. BC1034]|nr:hypothetical protein DFQ30_001253 [Apophysomyces sp. BC1015]KAG0190437.1 hypothetical protein DFQ28_002009 [Apophysomyces sp. BC1034]
MTLGPRWLRRRLQDCFIAASRVALVVAALAAHAVYAIAQYGEPKYAPGFSHFDYVNPDALKGGTLTLANPNRITSFDKFNPFTLRGNVVPGVDLMFETLMTGSADASLHSQRNKYWLISSKIFRVLPDFFRGFSENTTDPMQHIHLKQACARVVASVFFSALMAGVSGAYADEAGSLKKNVSAGADLQASAAQSGTVQDGAQYAQQGASHTFSSNTHSFLSGMAAKAGDVVVGALNMIGVRYRWGGNSPDSGLDCSGFVRYVFQDTLGMKLPRRAEEMSRVGEKVNMSELKPGDLVFFNTMRRTFSHVGIYIGDNKFVHSPSTGSTIRVDELDHGYWEKRFTGARRLEVAYPTKVDASRQ